MRKVFIPNPHESIIRKAIATLYVLKKSVGNTSDEALRKQLEQVQQMLNEIINEKNTSSS